MFFKISILMSMLTIFIAFIGTDNFLLFLIFGSFMFGQGRSCGVISLNMGGETLF